jgi:hypothetical protein
MNNFLDVALYKDPACTQEFKGTDQVEPGTDIYTKFSLEEFIGTGNGGTPPDSATITIKDLGGIYGEGTTVYVYVTTKKDGLPMGYGGGKVNGDSLTALVPLMGNGSYYIGFSSEMGMSNYYISQNARPLNSGMVLNVSYFLFDHMF